MKDRVVTDRWESVCRDVRWSVTARGVKHGASSENWSASSPHGPPSDDARSPATTTRSEPRPRSMTVVSTRVASRSASTARSTPAATREWRGSAATTPRRWRRLATAAEPIRARTTNGAAKVGGRRLRADNIVGTTVIGRTGGASPRGGRFSRPAPNCRSRRAWRRWPWRALARWQHCLSTRSVTTAAARKARRASVDGRVHDASIYWKLSTLLRSSVVCNVSKRIVLTVIVNLVEKKTYD